MADGMIGRGTCGVACVFALFLGGVGGFYFGSGRDGAGEESMRSADGGGHDVAAATNETSPANQRVRRTDDPPPSNPKKDSDDDVSEDDKIWMRDALKKEKERREAAEFKDDDTGRKILEKIQNHAADPTPLFSSFERFSKPLRLRPDPEKVVHLTPENANKFLAELARGAIEPTTFLLSAGTFDLNRNFDLRNADHVVIRGEGMDRTIVKTSGSFVFAADVQQVTIENFTIDGAERGDEMLDSRGPAAFLFSRVRTFGFDCGAGGSSAIIFGAPIYVGFENCEILGGYGRNPMGGSAAAVRGLGFAYFKDCRLRELSVPAFDGDRQSEGSRVVFDGCRFSHIAQLTRSETSSVAFRGCSFDGVFSAEGARIPPRFDLGGNSVTLIERNSIVPTMQKILAIEAMGDSILGLKFDGWPSVVYADVLTVGNPAPIVRWFLPPGGSPEKRPGAHIDRITSEGSGSPPIRLSTAAASVVAALATEGSTPEVRSAALSRNGERRIWRIETSHGTKSVDAGSGELLD